MSSRDPQWRASDIRRDNRFFPNRKNNAMRLLLVASTLSFTLLSACAQQPAKPAASAPAAAASAPAPVTTSTGLVYQALVEGTGSSPAATDTVKVHYRGTFLDGREFDSSYKRGQPIEFALNRVIPCWTEGVQRMKPGGKARLTCPPGIAYGAAGAGGVIPPNSTLQFEVELISVRK
jgi:FKBP-type peptidyl-prolyl cis-trans isomerase FkpA